MDATEKRPLLEVENLVKKYDNQTENEAVIECLNLTVNQDDFLCILGPSGCGKTTLLRCIASFETYQGEIRVEGRPIKSPGPDRIVVFQDFNQLFPWQTVEGNVEGPLKINGIKDKAERKALAHSYLEKVGLLQYKNYYPHQLSGGMKQRVAISKALALRPKIILMDEPFASLDAMTRNGLQREFLKIKEKENMTVIFVTHNIQEAIVLGNRVLVMSRGGEIVENMYNPIPKPTTPSSAGFSGMWDHLSSLL